MAPRIFTTRTRVRYAETDAARVVYYGNFLVYFEVGRIEMFRELGLPYDRRLPIAETYARYHSPALYDDVLEIRSHVAEVRRAGFRIACEVHRIGDDGASELLAEGFTAMVTVGDDHRPAPLPEAFRAAFDRAT